MRRAESDPDAAEPAGQSGPDVEIRRARTPELDAVGQLTLAAYSFDGFAHADYASRLSDAATRDREAEIWVAATPDELLGCVTYCPPGSPWRELAGDDTDGEFRMLAVAPTARGRGVGSLLVHRCLDRSRELGQRRMLLCTDRRMVAAHRLYAAFGFTRLPALDWSPVAGVELLAYSLQLRS
ncbi:MAG TPA: GNAT family N-acetyltransferase [Nocardioidaceae bacterium]|jgi:ribosomal protein S18 acetylase RimI-like enzyme|nr:GNAT family N-acetyltransferase [Nocardioidaceae bacterium]